MDKVTFSLNRTISGQAVYLGERILHRDLEGEQGELGIGCYALTVCQEGYAVLFRFGVVVLFGVDTTQEAIFLERIAPQVVGKFAKPRRESVEIGIGSANRFTVQGGVQLAKGDIPSLAVVADVLAKSLILEHYESEVAKVFDKVEPLAEGLRQGRRVQTSIRDLLRQTGEALLVEHRTVGRVVVTERPAILWEYPDLEKLHHDLTEEYEITDRSRALERKLSVITRTTELVLGLIQTHRSLRLEWYIVILICIEIGLSLYELFGHRV